MAFHMTWTGNYPSVGSISTQRSEMDIQWDVHDFLQVVPHSFDSPFFSFLNHSWHLKLVWNNDGKGFIAVSLHNKQPTVSGISLTVTMGLKKADGAVEIKETSNRTFEKKLSWNECSCFWNMSDVIERKSELLPSGTLIVTCTLQEKMENHEDVMKVTGLETLSANFRDLLTSKSQCDVSIKVKDSEFQAHKVILVARSPVFASAFEHDMSEKETGIINIEDCDPHSFGEFLQYLYTGKIEEVTFTDAYNLYITADKYGVKELKTYCVTYMIRNLSIDNVCDVVSLSDLYEETELMATAQKYFNQNIRKILSTEEWETLMKSNFTLANKLLKDMAAKVRIVF